jgi:C-terminal processing protease CtpA/Prc
MDTMRFLGALAIVLLAAPLGAQQPPQLSDKDRNQAEKQMQKAEQQIREAEQQIREAEQQIREAAARLGRVDADSDRHRIERKLVIFSDRARLGLVLRPDANPESDAVGAYVEALTPGSPAEEAGLQPGDIIVKFNGEALATAKPQGDEERSAPTERLMELAQDLKDGDKVTLEYRRGSENRTVTVTATRAMGPHARMILLPKAPLLDIPAIEVPDVGDIDVNVYTTARPWRDVQLVALNSGLAEYFGTTEGLLVVSTPKDSPLKLTAGDVILKIGDRTPASPEQAIRILRSYEPGESVAIQVMRKREKMTVSVQMPAQEPALFPWHGGVPKPPQPPAAPPPPSNKL